MKYLIFLFSIVVLLVGCSTKNPVVKSLGDYTYIVTATGRNEWMANNLINAEAATVCSKYGKHPKLISRKIKYRGVTEDQKHLIYEAKRVLGKNGEVMTTDQDYRITYKFKCN